MEDEEDDLYGTEPVANGDSSGASGHANGDNAPVKQEEAANATMDDEEDEDEDDSESDIDIITERKDAPAPISQDFKRVKQEPVRISSAPEAAPSQNQQPTPIKSETPIVGGKLAVKDGSQYPEYRSSNIDLNGTAIYDPAGKPITEVDLDADVAMETKPWRVPGTDPTDFFNYGFDEFTWVQYCMKQKEMRDTVGGLKNEHKQFEAMFGGGQQQAMPAMPSMPGMPDMNPEMMNSMMANMQAQGMDPNQMDFNAFMQQMQQMGMPGMPGGGGGAGFGQGQQNQGQGFGNFGGQNMQHQNSNQGYGQQHGQSPFPGNQGFGGGTPQPQQQGMGQPPNFEGYSPQQIAMLQQQGGGGGGGGRGRGRGRRW
ncbi:Fip1 motif-containing protein [Elsinoe australis]|uniref:Fip1 motif-containing protein n=1 Tax=Elsinoe australis TaxID=40998 RepID=A0A4U7AYM0_9PEZI|nr:Fip1 motif-containing protein [Elsinoe australis]